MISLRSLAPLVLTLLSITFTTVQAGVDLCGAPGRLPPMDRFDCLIHQNPNLSCGQLFFQVAAMNPNAYTNQMLGLFGNMCCNANVAKQCIGHPGGNQGGSDTNNNNNSNNNVNTVGRPSGYGGRGPNGTCNICQNGGTLDDTYNARGQKLHYNLRYIGRANAGFSCQQFDWLGKNGYIPNFMCGPVISILPRYCPVCSGGGGASQQQQQQVAAPQQTQSFGGSGESGCGRYRNNKNGCKSAGCKYNKKFGTCIAK
ncbi:unnamed protein product [Cylindrotheca closterium]|uniref:Secreted protein n=1 Tax=Cylindrotheca closterium TaxID=2856 RepID=A0AAD2G1F9_9STRA|nr:unnamed protein product [Cylindrotheca closterium]